jgi:hypothetical protein
MASSGESVSSSGSSDSSSPLPARVLRRSKALIAKPNGEIKGKLITQIEDKFGGLAGVSKYNIRDLCDEDPDTFGVIGSPERRGIQKQVYNWKRSSRAFLADKNKHQKRSTDKDDLEINMSHLHFSGKGKRLSLAKKKSFVDSDGSDDEEQNKGEFELCQRRLKLVLYMGSL